MREKYKEVAPEILEVAFKTAYPMRCMKAWEAEGRDTTYVGSCTDGNLVTDYYKDDVGAFWYENRGIVNGQIVSMDVYLFGHEIKRRKEKQHGDIHRRIAAWRPEAE